MMKEQTDVKTFTHVAKYPYRTTLIHIKNLNDILDMPGGKKETLRQYLEHRITWMREELDEFDLALDENNIAEMMDALADELYFVLGTALTLGFDLGLVFDTVHAANMKKFSLCACTSPEDDPRLAKLDCKRCGGNGYTAKFRESDGKLQKPENWKPPDITGLMNAIYTSDAMRNRGKEQDNG